MTLVPGTRFRRIRGAFRARDTVWNRLETGSTNACWKGTGPSGEWFLKWYKTPLPGTHPEVEIAQFLHERQFPGTPRFGGALLKTCQGTLPRTVATVLGWEPGMSGWDFLLAELASGRLPLEPCKRLGKQLAQLHQVLASGDTGSAFCSFIDSEYSLRCLHRIRRLEEQLSAALESPPPKGTHLAVWEDARNRWNESLLAWEARLTPLLQTTGATIVSRVHGDLHLGQLLLNKSGDWRFMDFEGEPLRSLEERRLCDSPLRDVAGICRSLAYATAVAHAPERCEQMLRDAFLSEWTSQSSHLTKHSPTLLEALVREKNIYEVLYEIRHRPAWLHIPLRNL